MTLTDFLKSFIFCYIICLDCLIKTKTTDINFISNNVKRIQNSQDEIKWKDKFKGELFFSHEKTNLCGVAIGYTGKRSFKLLKKNNDETLAKKLREEL